MFTLRHARRLLLTGWVRNEADGSVRVVAEGPAGQLDLLVAELRRGPSGARVESIEQRVLPATGESPSFEVRPDG